MSELSKSDIERARGIRAEQLIKDEILIEAFAELERMYLAAWRATGIRDLEAREKLFLAVNVVGKVQDHLGKVIANGKLAQAELNQLAQRPKILGII